MTDPSASADIAEDREVGEAYGPHYFRHYWGAGGPYERNERWMEFFGRVADGIFRDLHPASVLDAGCAMGMLVETLSERGVDAWGIDVSEYAISQVDESIRDRCRVASITDPLPRRYDLVTCIEVIEHIPPAEAGKAIANLCAASERVLLSSTPRDYGEPTHLNVRQPEEWAAEFARQGFLRDLDHDPSYLSPWAALYIRSEEPVAETVRRYERSWWRLKWEAFETRDSLLELKKRLREYDESATVIGDQAELRASQERQQEELERLQGELGRQQEELLHLRDLLIGKDAELGLARGRLAELEDRSARLTNALGQLQARIPGFLWRGAGGLRRLGRRS